MITLVSLNNFVRDIPLESGLIQPDEILTSPLWAALKGRINTRQFEAGNKVQVLLRTRTSMTGGPTYENADIKTTGTHDYTPTSVRLAEVEVNAGLTLESLRLAEGMPGSWGRAVTEALEVRGQDFDLMMDAFMMQAGYGALARVVSATGTTTTTITFDNTYGDFGVENVGLIKEGMQVEFGVAATAVARTGASSATSFEVTGVTFGDRKNGAATTGTITVTDDGTLAGVLADNDYCYLRGSIAANAASDSSTGLAQLPAPMGLVAHVASRHTGRGTDNLSGLNAITTYEGVTRSTYQSLNSYCYDAVDFASGSAGTPDDWTLDSISTAFDDCNNGSGKGMPNLLLCSSRLAMAIARKQKSEGGINITVSNAAAEAEQTLGAVGTRVAGRFMRPDGVWVPIAVANTIPHNVLYGVNTADLILHVKDGFNNLAPQLGLQAIGDVWMKSPGDRKRNFEAPFGGLVQVTGIRCDRHFLIQDLTTA